MTPVFPAVDRGGLAAAAADGAVVVVVVMTVADGVAAILEAAISVEAVQVAVGVMFVLAGMSQARAWADLAGGAGVAGVLARRGGVVLAAGFLAGVRGGVAAGGRVVVARTGVVAAGEDRSGGGDRGVAVVVLAGGH